MTSSTSHIVFVSKNKTLSALFQFYLKGMLGANLEILDNETHALSYLRQTQIFPLLLIYDYEASSFLVEDLYLILKQNERRIHIIIINEHISQEGINFFKDLPLFHLKSKDNILDDIVDLYFTIFINHQENTQSYIPISLDCLNLLKGIDHALYLKLPSDKYIKLLNEGESFDTQDIQKFKLKKITHLHIPCDALSWMTTQIQNQFSYFLKDKTYKFHIRDPLVSTHMDNERIISVTEDKYLEKEYKDEILALMDKTLNVLLKHPKIEHIISKINLRDEKTSYYSKKVRLTSLVSCFLARELQWNSKATLEKLVFASFLHDITIAHDPKLIKIRDLTQFHLIENDLTEIQKKQFLSHPEQAASLVSNSFKNIPFETNTLILQHQEIPDGVGFPQKIKWDKISPLSSLFIISCDFVNYILEDSYPSIQEYLLLAEKKYGHSMFKKIYPKLTKINFSIHP
jgi:HD-GYP domain-containing protein (c-di-GMP phosphodiesterase class II)